MQTTISLSQEHLARLEGAWDAQKKELSERLARVTSLESKNVLFNDLRKTIQGLKAEVEAQRYKATALSLDSAIEQNKQGARLNATEKALEKQDQIVKRAMDRILVLEEQAATRNTRTESFEKKVVDRLLALEGQSLKGNARAESFEKRVVDRLFALEGQSLERNTRIEFLEKQDPIVQRVLDRLLTLEDQSLKRDTRIESLDEQKQTVQSVVDRLLVLEDQSLNTRIESLENQPDVLKDIPRLWAKLSDMEQARDGYLKILDSQIQTLRVGLQQTRAETVELSKRLATGLGNQALIQHNVSEMQTKIAHIEQHETKIAKRLESIFSKRLDDMDISRQAVALQDFAARIDELSQSLEALKRLPTSLAEAEEVRLAAFRAELKAFYQNQAAAKQHWQAKQAANTNDTNLQVVQRLTQKLNKIDWVLDKHMNDSREKFNQLVDGDVYARGMGRSAKESSDVAAVVDSLCRRVGAMETGFEVMRDVICTCRR